MGETKMVALTTEEHVARLLISNSEDYEEALDRLDEVENEIVSLSENSNVDLENYQEPTGEDPDGTTDIAHPKAGERIERDKQPQECPNCGGQLYGDHPEFYGDGEMSRKIECEDCGWTGIEEWSIDAVRDLG